MRYPIHLSSNYAETRRPASEQRTVNLYPHSLRGFRQFPGLLDFASLSGPADTGNEGNVTVTSGHSIQGATLVNDGTMLFTLDTDEIIRRQPLLTAYDLSTIQAVDQTYDVTANNGSYLNATRGIQVLDEGRKIYISDNAGTDELWQLTLTTGYDLTSVASADTASIAGVGTQQIEVSADGLTAMLLDNAGGNSVVRQYSIATAFRIQDGFTDDSKSFDFSIFGTSNVINCFVYPPGGDRVIFTETASNTFYEHQLGTVDDITTVESAYIGDGDWDTVTGETVSINHMSITSNNRLVLANNANIDATTKKVHLITIAGESTAALSDGCRNAKNMGGVAYTVSGSRLWSIDSSGTPSFLGSITGSQTGSTEYVTNGDLSTDTTVGWTNSGFSTFTVTGGRLSCVADAGQGDSCSATVATLIAGQSYVLSFDYEITGGSVADTAGSIKWGAGITGTGTIVHTFTASGTDTLGFTDGQLWSGASSFFLDNVSISDGPGRVGMETDGTQLVITTGTTIYLYTVAGGLTTITDADINDTANTSAYLDLRFYYDQPNGQFVASAVDDASDIDALDFATAESFSDGLLAVYAHNRYLYLFGEASIEVWFTSQGRPPVDREQVIERGIIGSHAVNSIDNKIYFVDHERRPNVMSGLEYLPIGAPSLGIEWDTYSTVSDCIVQTYSWQNENFIEFIFPTQDVSWTLHEPSGEWVEREDVSNTRFSAGAYVNAYSKTLAFDKSNGQIYQLSDTAYQDDGSNITRLMQTGLVTSEVLGQPDRSMTVDTLYLTLESTGAGTVSVAAAYDGGSFETARDITVAAGVETYALSGWGECRELIFQISTTSNIGLDIISGSIEGEVLHD